MQTRTMKKCKRCGHEQDINNFSKDLRLSDNHVNVCFDCDNKVKRVKLVIQKRKRNCMKYFKLIKT